MKIAEAVYEGYTNVRDVPLWRTHGEQAKADDRMRIVDDPLGKRGKVMRVEVRPGDSAVAGSNAGERADVMCGSSTVPMREGSIVAVSCPIMLPNEFQSNSSGWNVCFGAHDKDGSTQSPLQMEIRNGKELRMRVLGGTHTGGLGTWSFRVDLGPWILDRNRWYDLVYANLFSWDKNKGRIVISLDGKTVVDAKVANLYQGSYCYHKQGWYRVAQSYPTVLYFDSTIFYSGATLDAAVAEANANLGYGGITPVPVAKVRKIAEDNNATPPTITLAWDPVPGADGFRFSAEKQERYSHGWNGTQTQTKFAQGSAWYKVEALHADVVGEYRP